MSGQGGARSGYRSALRSRDLRLLLSGEAISGAGSGVAFVAIAAFVFDQTHSSGWVAAGVLGRFIPVLLLSTYGGVVAERFERVRLMVGLNVAALVVQCGLALAVWRAAPVVVVIAIAGLSAILGTPYKPAVAAVVPQVVGEDDLAAANALNGTIDNLVMIAGPSVGAVVVLLGGSALAFVVNAVTFGVAALLVGRLRARSSPSDVTDGGRAGPMRQMADGFRAVASSATVLTFVSFSVLATFVYGTDTVLFVPLSAQQLHTGSSGYGYLLAGLGLGGLAGAAVVNRLAARPRLAMIILGGMALYTLPSALLVVVHQPVIGFLVEVVRGAGTLVVDTLAITSLQRSAPREMVARVFGVFFALALAALCIGVAITPLLLRAGLHVALLVYSFGVPALCLVALPRLRRLDRVAAGQAALLAPRVTLFQGLDLFAAASRASLEGLAEAAIEIEVPAEAAVVTEGDEADAFYVVEAGTLEVSAVGEGGEARWLRTLGEGTYFGEIGLLARVARTATVTASSPCRLLRIGGDDFVDALTNLTASSSLLEGARTRLAVTHPSRTGLIETDPPIGAGGVT